MSCTVRRLAHRSPEADSYADPVTDSRLTSPRLRVVTLVTCTLAVLIIGVLTVWSTSSRPAPQEQPLTLATGLEGGVYYELGETLEELTRDSAVPLSARESAASEVNLKRVAEGEVDVAFTTSDVAHLAATGGGPFENALPIRALAKLYDQPTHLVVLADSEYAELADLTGSTVSVGAEGSGTRMQALRLLEVADLADDEAVETRSMDLLDSVAALEEGQVDAFFWSGGLPTEAVTQLADRTPIRLIDLSEWVEPLAQLGQAHYEDVPVPVDSYPGVPGVRTVGVSSLLVVAADFPQETAEALTVELFASRTQLVESHPVVRQLNERTAISTLPVELHPGALTYYHRAKPAHRLWQQGPPGE